jgi:hypothetical protein
VAHDAREVLVALGKRHDRTTASAAAVGPEETYVGGKLKQGYNAGTTRPAQVLRVQQPRPSLRIHPADLPAIGAARERGRGRVLGGGGDRQADRPGGEFKFRAEQVSKTQENPVARAQKTVEHR